MTDQLLGESNDEPTALVPIPTCADGNSMGGGDVDYLSDTDSDKPVILELGVRPKPTQEQSNLLRLLPVVAGTAQTYRPDYPLDMQLQSAAAATTGPYMGRGYLGETEDQAAAGSLIAASHLSLYNNNPYSQHHQTHHMQHHHRHQHQHHHHHQSPLSEAGPMSVLSAVYPLSASQIPHSVSTWPNASELGRRAASQLVPPPMYISYSGAREHVIAKESNPSWKEKALQLEKDYKKTACDRERTRMRDMNRAFDLLRAKLPISKPNGKKYSKIESLRIAINYINHLQACLRDGPPESEDGANASNKDMNAADYIANINARHRLQRFHNDNRKKDMDQNDDQSGTWSDNSYVPNGQNDHWD